MKPKQTWLSLVGVVLGVLFAAGLGCNLPGLSVAVGAGGDLVWAEGFGWAGSREPCARHREKVQPRK